MNDDPPAEESTDRLRRSESCAGPAGFSGPGGASVWQVDGRNGENQLLVRGTTAREAWWRAVEAAAACGMLESWPRPTAGTEAGGLPTVDRHPRFGARSVHDRAPPLG